MSREPIRQLCKVLSGNWPDRVLHESDDLSEEDRDDLFRANFPLLDPYDSWRVWMEDLGQALMKAGHPQGRAIYRLLVQCLSMSVCDDPELHNISRILGENQTGYIDGL